MAPTVEDVVRDLALADRKNFRASYVAQQTGLSTAEAQRKLFELVEHDALTVHLDLLSPADHTTVASYAFGEAVPRFFEDEDSGVEFEVSPDLIWITFSPSPGFRFGVRTSGSKRDESNSPGKARGPRRSEMRARAAKVLSWQTPFSTQCRISSWSATSSPDSSFSISPT